MSRSTPSLTLFDLVMKLSGPVEAIGDHRADMDRLENLKGLTGLVDELLQEIRYSARTAGHQYDSMNKVGSYAKKYLEGVRNELSE